MLKINEATRLLYEKDGMHRNMRIYFPGLDMTFDNSHIVSGTFQLVESIQSNTNLEFVGCIATSVSVELADITVDVKGQWMEVYVSIEDTEEIPLFHGIVDSASKEAYKNHKRIEAYDVLYSLSLIDISSWYNNHRKTNVEKLFYDLMEYLGVEVGNVKFVNGGLPTYCSESQLAESLAAIDLLKSICQINGVFGRINRYGQFETFSIDNSEGAKPYEIQSYEPFEHEEYTVQPVNCVVIRNSSSDGGIGFGDGNNRYVIEGNMFAMDWNTTEITQAVERIYNLVSNITYIPFEGDTYGLPFIECGDQISFLDIDLSDLSATRKNFYVFTRTISDVNSMRDNFVAEGEETYAEIKSTVDTNLSSLKAQMGEYSLIRFRYQNVRQITVGSTEVFLCQIDYKTKMATPMFMGEMLLTVVPDEETITSNVTIDGVDSVMVSKQDMPVTVSIRYTLDGETIDYYPVETYAAGEHVLNLVYFLNQLGDSGTFGIYMTATGGTVTIDENCLHVALIGQGRESAAVEWNGLLEFEETIKQITIVPPPSLRAIKPIRDNMTLRIIDPEVSTMTERIGIITLNGSPKTSIKALSDSLVVDTVVYAYTLNTAMAKYYSYDNTAVDISTGAFALNQKHNVEGIEETIDSGRMTAAEIDRSAFVSLNSLEVSLSYEDTAAQSKWLVSDGGSHYTIQNGELTLLGVGSLTSQVFIDYGFDSIPNGSLLLTLANPKVYYWHDSDDFIPVPVCNMTVTRYPQTIVTDRIPLNNSSIIGINGLTSVYSGNPIVWFSFDFTSTWEIYDGTEWVVSDAGMSLSDAGGISSEMWNARIEGISQIYMKVLISSNSDSVTNIVLDYIN